MPNDNLVPNWECLDPSVNGWYPVHVDSVTGVVTHIHSLGNFRDASRWSEFSEEFKVRKIEATPVEDNVNSPAHYGSGNIECIDYIEDFLTKEEFIGYLRGNIAKYMHRWRRKGKPVEDLEKANWYLNRLIKTEETK